MNLAVEHRIIPGKMQKAIKYTIFKTRWGYFGLAGTEQGILRTHLPVPAREIVKSNLLSNIDSADYDKNLFKYVQQQIIAYFDGASIDFSPCIPIVLDGFSGFIKSVLIACREIPFGKTISYQGLGEKLHRPCSARAVGSALAKNPAPLLIPCHRVIRSNGRIGGFSAPGGPSLKTKLILHESACRQLGGMRQSILLRRGYGGQETMVCL